MEGVVHSGWLVKSPPEKRIFKAKWRQRWFVLRHSGLLPGQFILEYFIDNACKKLKGRIDLDQCEQVDAGLTFESKKTSYQYMFDIRTPKRVYYLVAETEAEMNQWVECICSVCGLKIHIEEDFVLPQETCTRYTLVPSTNLTEVKSSSNPYIPISECHTGKPVLNGTISSNESLNDLPKDPPPPPPLQASASLSQWNSLDHVALSDEFYDHPKPLKPIEDETSQLRSNSQNDIFSSSSTSWNISVDDSVPLIASTVPTSKQSIEPEYDIVPTFHDSVKTQSNLADHFEKLCAKPVQDASPENSPSALCIPPRPPKPSKLRDRSCYENFRLPAQNECTPEPGDLSPSTKVPVQTSVMVDDTYDFPKFRTEDGTLGRQRRHAYTNAPPGLFNNKDLIFNYEYRPSLNTDVYVINNGVIKNNLIECDTPPSPSAIGAYANVPTSPEFPPPVVNRDLKPKRVNNNEEKGILSILTLEPPPGCKSKAKTKNFRSSPTQSPSLNIVPPLPNRFRAQLEVSATSDDELSSSSGSRRNSSTDDQARHQFSISKKDEIQYLDLDLDSEPSPSPKSPERMCASTVYKKVDFLKTKAFNEMRQNVEETYRKSQ